MKKKLCLILLVLFCLYFVPAGAENAVAHYTLPDGAEMARCVDVDTLNLPASIQPVFPLLREDASSNAVAVRMPGGTVLFSLSAAPVRETLTPEQLVEKWSSVSRAMST